MTFALNIQDYLNAHNLSYNGSALTTNILSGEEDLFWRLAISAGLNFTESSRPEVNGAVAQDGFAETSDVQNIIHLIRTGVDFLSMSEFFGQHSNKQGYIYSEVLARDIKLAKEKLQFFLERKDTGRSNSDDVYVQCTAAEMKEIIKITTILRMYVNVNINAEGDNSLSVAVLKQSEIDNIFALDEPAKIADFRAKNPVIARLTETIIANAESVQLGEDKALYILLPKKGSESLLGQLGAQDPKLDVIYHDVDERGDEADHSMIHVRFANDNFVRKMVLSGLKFVGMFKYCASSSISSSKEFMGYLLEAERELAREKLRVIISRDSDYEDVADSGFEDSGVTVKCWHELDATELKNIAETLGFEEPFDAAPEDPMESDAEIILNLKYSDVYSIIGHLDKHEASHNSEDEFELKQAEVEHNDGEEPSVLGATGKWSNKLAISRLNEIRPKLEGDGLFVRLGSKDGDLLEWLQDASNSFSIDYSNEIPTSATLYDGSFIIELIDQGLEFIGMTKFYERACEDVDPPSITQIFQAESKLARKILQYYIDSFSDVNDNDMPSTGIVTIEIGDEMVANEIKLAADIFNIPAQVELTTEDGIPIYEVTMDAKRLAESKVYSFVKDEGAKWQDAVVKASNKPAPKSTGHKLERENNLNDIKLACQLVKELKGVVFYSDNVKKSDKRPWIIGELDANANIAYLHELCEKLDIEMACVLGKAFFKGEETLSVLAEYGLKFPDSNKYRLNIKETPPDSWEFRRGGMGNSGGFSYS